MRIGICTGMENILFIKELGFEYAELPLNSIAALSESEFAQLERKVEDSGVAVEAFNCFFPGSMKLTGPQADRTIIREYAGKALRRAAALGGKIAVVGSGGARRVPDGWDLETGWRQFAHVLEIIGEEASILEITAVVEPLHRGETNLINCVADGIRLVRQVSHPHVKLLADFYHMRLEAEPFTSIREAGELLKHVHLANSTGRVYPADRKEDLYERFFETLKEIGYNGRISIEAVSTDISQDGPCALRLLKELAE